MADVRSAKILRWSLAWCGLAPFRVSADSTGCAPRSPQRYEGEHISVPLDRCVRRRPRQAQPASVTARPLPTVTARTMPRVHPAHAPRVAFGQGEKRETLNGLSVRPGTHITCAPRNPRRLACEEVRFQCCYQRFAEYPSTTSPF